jgi:hypothetical protein
LPFELRAVEAALDLLLETLESETGWLEKKAGPAVDRLLQKVSSEAAAVAFLRFPAGSRTCDEATSHCRECVARCHRCFAVMRATSTLATLFL